MDKKIIVCTTFREFNGNSNDYIQRLFLKSLREQTYQNYILVATTFGEQNVEKTLIEENIPHKVFKGSVNPEFRFSATQVLENGISLVDAPGSYLVMWTTCDDIFEPDFFKKMIDTMSPLTCATSLPHIVYKTVEAYKDNKISSYCYGGIDTVCFGGDIFLNPEVKKVIHDYPNQGWGFFEYFLSGVGKVFSKDMINLWPTKLARIDNNRAVGNETEYYFNVSSTHNGQNYRKFKEKFKITGGPSRSIFYYKTSWKYADIKIMTFLMLTKYRLQNLFFKSILFRMIPRHTKEWVKKILVSLSVLDTNQDRVKKT